jgi:hypothetical protein
MLAPLRCGYDTDCTLATAAALIGQILGASRIPAALKEAVGDELVMGIEYRRDEMTLSALAHDTARMGVLMRQALDIGVTITDAPAVAPLPESAQAPAVEVDIEYEDLPSTAPGQTVQVDVVLRGQLSSPVQVSITGPDGWRIVPDRSVVEHCLTRTSIALHAPLQADIWPMQNLFAVNVATPSPIESRFGVVGTGIWRFLGVYFDALPDPDDMLQIRRRFVQHFVSLSPLVGN